MLKKLKRLHKRALVRFIRARQTAIMARYELLIKDSRNA